MAANRRDSCRARPGLRHFQYQQRSNQKPCAEDREDDRVPPREAQDVWPGVERIEQETTHEPGDDPRPGGRDVAETRQEPRLVTGYDVLNESPVDRIKHAVADPDQDSRQG